MNRERVEKIANAVLYEGYLLYPYTASAVKNQHRWNFGVLHPPGLDTSEMQTECLVMAAQPEGSGAVVSATIRFLQLTDAEDAEERRVEAELELPRGPVPHPFRLAGAAEIAGELELSAETVEAGIYRICIKVRNLTRFDGESREAALRHSLLSTHTILTVRGGEFLSLMDPPERYRAAAEACRNIGTWPVLAGAPGERDTMLSSPVILYDYPQVAPESPGDLFDGTEIDEILTLRILTLSDEEKAEIRAGGERARRILERSETLPPEQLMKLHGALRGLGRTREWKAGDVVRLHPRRGGDIMDIALAGKRAIIEAVEEDYEGRVHLAVVLEDDPGRDLGIMRQPGHRFFFTPEEVEAIR